MRYFSMFSGIGGFEKGIEDAESIREYEQRTRSEQYLRHARRSTSSQGESRQDNEDIRQIQPQDTKSGRDIVGWECKSSWDNRISCVGYSEIDRYASAIFRYHYPTIKNYGDATRIIPERLPDIDAIVGGFPCQSFSIAGKREAFSDIRGTLFFEICRIARIKKPAYLWLENVKGLLSAPYTEAVEQWAEEDFDEDGEPTKKALKKHKTIAGTKGWVFLTILNTLWELGYDCQWQMLNSKFHRVPQNRERVFIIGHLRGKSRPKVFPIRECNQADISLQTLTSRYFASTSNGNYLSYPTERRFSRVRRLTPTECERLQGFPDGWTKYGTFEDGITRLISDSQRYKCLGNAVTTNVIRDILLNWH